MLGSSKLEEFARKQFARITNAQAGGFAMEDPDLLPLLDRIEGSPDSVFGLPVDLLCELIEKLVP